MPPGSSSPCWLASAEGTPRAPVADGMPRARALALRLGCPSRRKLLFDMGTARWGSSLAWLVDKYRWLGVEFDEIYAWWVGGWVGG